MTAASSSSFLLSGLLLIFATGCGDGEREVEVSVAPRLVIGTGEAEFQPIEGEPTIELAAGFQGGFHVWVSFLAYGVDEDRLKVELYTQQVDDIGTRLKLGGLLQFVPDTDADGVPVYRLAGYPGQLKSARCADGKHVLIEATMTDSNGRTAHDERHCIVTLAEQYRSQNCP